MQTRVQTEHGVITIAPLGKWTDWLFSEEVHKYTQLGGYEFEVIRGYTFGKKDIFSQYVTDMYKIKESTTKQDPMYLISKLLMNYLYGRFGMNTELPIHEIIRDNEIEGYLMQYKNLKVHSFSNGLSIVAYMDNSKKDIFSDLFEELMLISQLQLVLQLMLDHIWPLDWQIILSISVIWIQIV